MRILFLNAGPFRNYATTLRAFAMARFLAARGHEVSFLHAHHPDDYAAHGEALAGVRLLYVRDEQWVSEARGWRATAALLGRLAVTVVRRVVRALGARPELIVAVKPDPRTVWPAAVAAAVCGAELLLDVDDLEHAMLLKNYPGLNPAVAGLIGMTERHAWRLARIVTVASRRLEADYRARHPRVVYLKNGAAAASPAEFARPAVDRFFTTQGLTGGEVVAYLGNLYPCFDLERVIRIFGALASRCPDARLLIIGDGPSLPALRRQAADRGVPGRVVFTGRVEAAEVPAYLSRCAAFLFPQENVPMNLARRPLKLAEYIRHGKPVIAPDLGEIREELAGSPWLVGADAGDGDYVDALARALAARPPAAGTDRLRWELVLAPLDGIIAELLETRDRGWDGRAAYNCCVLALRLARLVLGDRGGGGRRAEDDNAVLLVEPGDQVLRTLAAGLEARGLAVTTAEARAAVQRALPRGRVAIFSYSRKIYFQELLRMYVAFFLARRQGKRTIVFMGNDYADICREGLVRSLFLRWNRFLLRRADRVSLLNSRAYLRERYALPESRVIRNDNYVDERFLEEPLHYEPYRPGAGRPLTIVYHGSILWWHGFERFLPIFARLRERHPGAVFEVIGHLRMNPFPRRFAREREFAARLRALRRAPGVVWTEWTERAALPDRLRRAHLHVSQLAADTLMADTELRTCLLEAMALGLPCLHCDSRALREAGVFGDLENLILIDPVDPAAAAARIDWLLADPERLRQIGARARATVGSHFRIERLVASIASLCR